MPKNQSSYRQKQPHTPAPSSHTYAVTSGNHAMQNDDDAEICPVCDGECTCHQVPEANPQSSPLSARYPQTLKIKLTLPSTKRSLSQPGTSTDLPSIQDRSGQPSAPPAPVVEIKRRGRPPKAPAQPRVTKTAAEPHGASSSTRRRGATRKPTTPPTAARKPARKPPSPPARRTQQPAPALVVAELDSDTESDSHGADSALFRTFVYAASSDDEDKETDSSSSTSIVDAGDDSSIEEEEERFIVEESRAQEKARKRKEMIPEKDNGREHDGVPQKQWKHHWESRPKKESNGSERGSDDRSGAGGESSDSGEESEEEDSEDDDDNDDDDKAEGQAPGSILPGTTAGEGWSDSEDEDDFDAALFFAGLSDSSANGTSDEEMNGSDDEYTDSEAPSQGETTGLVVPARQAEMTLMVTEDLDGKLVFSNNLKEGQGAFDVEFGAGPSETQNPTTSGADTSEGGNETEDEDDGTMDEDTFMDSDDGNTTDDDMMIIHGFVAPRGVPFRFPSPPMSAINPLSTVSPQVKSQGRRSRPPHSSSSMSSAICESPNPSDILARSSFWDENNHSASVVLGPQDFQPTSPILDPPATPRQPVMGTFFPQLSNSTPKAIIGDNTTAIPSPFPRTRIRRKTASLRGHKRSGSKNDILAHHPRRRRQLSLPGGSRAPAFLDDDDDVQSSPELPPPIRLDDVLEASFLEDSNPMMASTITTASEPYETRRHTKNLTRWDRVPMGTFRRTRAAGGVVDEIFGGLASAIVLAPSNDGFSYGATSGSILRKSSFPSSPFDGPRLYENDSHTQTHSPKKSRRRSSMSSRATNASHSVNISPVIFPVRDPSERTPTQTDNPDSMRYDSSEHALSSSATPAGQKLRKFKRKKRKRAAQHAANVHQVQQQTQHLPHPSSHHIHHARYRPAASSSRHPILTANVPPLRL